VASLFSLGSKRPAGFSNWDLQVLSLVGVKTTCPESMLKAAAHEAVEHQIAGFRNLVREIRERALPRAFVTPRDVAPVRTLEVKS
jgi:hypothetical protein